MKSEPCLYFVRSWKHRSWKIDIDLMHPLLHAFDVQPFFCLLHLGDLLIEGSATCSIVEALDYLARTIKLLTIVGVLACSLVSFFPMSNLTVFATIEGRGDQLAIYI